MKKTLIITTLALAAATGMALDASAQEANTPPGGYPAGARGHHGGGFMLQDLNLTDAQKAQVHDIMVQQREETHAKIRAILTPEQQAIFDARK
ncbi:MAG: hypothetical protein LBU72_07260 [Burkholderiaceae bacterium]|jgi:Spy/CpxP family protein refolding chaperone|nr:hypothetical protein [Burkholderiaceae bacterium]